MTVQFKKNINTLVILYLLILPHTVYSIINSKDENMYFLSLLVVMVLLFVNQFKSIIKTLYKAELLFVIILCTLSIITSIAHGRMSPGLAFIAPFVTYIGYVFIRNKSINFNLKIFNVVFIFLYVYFYIIYFGILPDFIYRSNFDEDLIVFESASSNGISIALNITLYSYLILNYFFKQKRERDIFIIALINFIFIVIQQSRAGLIVGLVLLFISIYELYGSRIKKYLFYVGIPAIILVATFSDYITNYLSLIGGMSGIETYMANERKFAAVDFFNGLNINNFIFGYSPGTSFNGLSYTFNVFLDFWSTYSFLGLSIFVFILIRRFILWKKYKFPIYYFLPFLFYAFVESWFFPMYWDVIIYLLIFVKHEKFSKFPI